MSRSPTRKLGFVLANQRNAPAVEQQPHVDLHCWRVVQMQPGSSRWGILHHSGAAVLDAAQAHMRTRAHGQTTTKTPRPVPAIPGQQGLAGGGQVDSTEAVNRSGTRTTGQVARSWSTAFLDFDEVLCIGQAEACLELSETFARGEALNQQHLATLFSPVARNALAVAHRRSGGVKYVISSSWREHFSREQMVLVLEGGGMYFVADNLHEGDAWRCLPKRVHRERQAEILDWLETHHEGEPFVVLDDHYSAGQLAFAHHFPDSALFGRVVLCTPGIGLTMEYVDDIVNALLTPVGPKHP